MSSLFMGEYKHTLDTKGRLIVPSKFREPLGERFIVSRGVDYCLSIYPFESWEALSKKLEEATGAEGRQMRRFFMSGASDTEIDKQGRILIPQQLRSFSNLKKDVVFAGVGDHIELWDAEAWEENKGFSDPADFMESLEKFGI